MHTSIVAKDTHLSKLGVAKSGPKLLCFVVIHLVLIIFVLLEKRIKHGLALSLLRYRRIT